LSQYADLRNRPENRLSRYLSRYLSWYLSRHLRRDRRRDRRLNSAEGQEADHRAGRDSATVNSSANSGPAG
jgi:hypothetical protein